MPLALFRIPQGQFLHWARKDGNSQPLLKYRQNKILAIANLLYFLGGFKVSHGGGQKSPHFVTIYRIFYYIKKSNSSDCDETRFIGFLMKNAPKII